MNQSQSISKLAPFTNVPFWQNLVESNLRKINRGALELRYSSGVCRAGAHNDTVKHVHVHVHHPNFFRRVALGGTLGAAESYMNGDWDCDDLPGLIRLILQNQTALNALENGFSKVGIGLASLWHRVQRNTTQGSRRNIAAHYDLGNDFFARMLDPTLSYSSALFASADTSLEAGSRNKLDIVCKRLSLKPGEKLLEIGTGWGAQAFHAHQKYGADVTTTTLSRAQYEHVHRQIQTLGLGQGIHLLNQDYRELTGRFDKIVSIEMIEAVGAQFYETFFAQCDRLLKPGGQMLLQAITIQDQTYAQHLREADFIKRYIFPGSNIPSVTALLNAATRASNFRLVEMHDFGADYARTLQLWRENLQPHRKWVIDSYGEDFWRMWMFYLAYCEAGFAESYISVAHLLLQKSNKEPS